MSRKTVTASLRRVGLSLPRVPLEHLFSIYGMLLVDGIESRPATAQDVMVLDLDGSKTRAPLLATPATERNDFIRTETGAGEESHLPG